MDGLRNCGRCGRNFRFYSGFSGAPPAGSDVCPQCCHAQPWNAEPWRDRALTFRERQIVDCVRQGKLNKEIAYELQLEEGTVKAYLHQIFRKLGVANRTGLAVFAAEQILEKQPDPIGVPAPLSPRQRQLAALVRQGKKNGEIAVELHLSPSSVREYLSRLYKKVNAEGRTQLAVLATLQQWPAAEPPETDAARLDLTRS